MAEVTGLNMAKIVASIKWRGQVALHQTGEQSESLLGEIVWPKKSGNTYYACATTGLLFDKTTGVCLQTQRVALLVATLTEAKPKDLQAFMAQKKDYGYGYNGRRHQPPDYDDEE